MLRSESLLAARLFLAQQLVAGRLYFISNLGGRLSLYVMDEQGSVPEPLLPPHIALQNPDLVGGYPFYVFPQLGSILVMLDQDGDERYQPMLIPLEGGFPEPAFGEELAHDNVACTACRPDSTIIYLSASAVDSEQIRCLQADLATRTLTPLYQGMWESAVMDSSADQTRALLFESYTVGDHVLYQWQQDQGISVLYGRPLAQRASDEQVPLNAISDAHFTTDEAGVLLMTALFDDHYGLGYLPLAGGGLEPVTVAGTRHQGIGELEHLAHVSQNRYLLTYNIDGASWVYEGFFDQAARHMQLERLILDPEQIGYGVLESIFHAAEGDSYTFSFSTATSPTQLYLVQGDQRTVLTRERALGIPETWLSSGEDASFSSHDGLRISARLYLPASVLGYEGARPLVYYVHGGPQSQERPDFAWFSMPLIQYLTMLGFAVFVPNARGSTGYGLRYTKYIDHDWGGADRLDHVYAMTQVLPHDPRVDVRHAGVVGRSYGGYMTLTLATRHPELWSAAVDMFGPYDLLTFSERIPETWKPYFRIALGDPVADRELLVERSPRSYIEQLHCPMLVIQGKNDPRVIEQESRDVVNYLQSRQHSVEYLMFPDEGHDVLKFQNRVTCYNAIAAFFSQHLR